MVYLVKKVNCFVSKLDPDLYVISIDYIVSNDEVLTTHLLDDHVVWIWTALFERFASYLMFTWSLLNIKAILLRVE